MGGTIGVFLGACHILSLGQGTIDEAVFCIHDGRLSITSCFFEYAIRSPVACLQQMHIVFSSLNLSQVFSQIVTDVLIVFQQLDGKITGRIMLAYVVVGLQILLYFTDAALDFMTIVNMKMTGLLVGTFIYLDNSLEQVLDAITVFEGCRYDRHSEQSTKHIEVDRVTASFKLIIHVECADDSQVHVHQLGGEVEIALQIG